MTLRPLFSAAALVASIAVPVLAHAQAEISAAEELRLEALARENAEIYMPKSHITVGFRVMSSGAKVNFGHLGTVGFDLTVAPRSDGAVDRVYDNGAVRSDAPRLNERGENNIQTSIPGQRYPTLSTVTVNIPDANGNVIGTEDVLLQTGDFVAYTPGLTRNWGYGAASQVTADGSHIGLSTYSATSDGATEMKKEGVSSGVEFQFIRTFSKSTQRLQWGLLAGVTLNGINGKSAGSVASTLNVRTDYYALPAGATAPALPYVGPTFVDYTTSTGEVLTTQGLETTVPLTAVPDSSTETAIPGGINVKGVWQVKGAYFLMRFGPSLRVQLTERLGVNASLGIAGAYAGSTYSVHESFDVPDVPDSPPVGSTAGPNNNGIEQSTTTKFLNGYYADFNVEWACNERTGLFGGITAQKLGDYNQSVGGRTALVDLGSAVGLRAGVSYKF